MHVAWLATGRYNMPRSLTVEWPCAQKNSQLCLIWGEQGIGQVMKRMKLTEVYSSINCIEIGVDYLRNHMIEIMGRFTLIMMSLPIYPRLYHLTLADLTFRNRGSGIPTQFLSHRVAYNSSKGREKSSSIGNYICMSSCRAGHLMDGPNRRIRTNTWSLAPFLNMESFCFHQCSRDRMVNRQWIMTDEDKRRCLTLRTRKAIF